MSNGWLHNVVGWLFADIFRFVVKTHEMLHLKIILNTVQSRYHYCKSKPYPVIEPVSGVEIEDWVSAGVKFNFCYSLY